MVVYEISTRKVRQKQGRHCVVKPVGFLAISRSLVKFVQAEDVHYLYEIAWNKPGASTSSADDDEDMETPCVWELEAMQIEDNESNSAVLGNECISVVIITN